MKTNKITIRFSERLELQEVKDYLKMYFPVEEVEHYFIPRFEYNINDYELDGDGRPKIDDEGFLVYKSES